MVQSEYSALVRFEEPSSNQGKILHKRDRNVKCPLYKMRVPLTGLKYFVFLGKVDYTFKEQQVAFVRIYLLDRKRDEVVRCIGVYEVPVNDVAAVFAMDIASSLAQAYRLKGYVPKFFETVTGEYLRGAVDPADEDDNGAVRISGKKRSADVVVDVIDDASPAKRVVVSSAASSSSSSSSSSTTGITAAAAAAAASMDEDTLASRVAQMERDERRYVSAPTDNWIRKTLRSRAYDILPNDGGGDGFFLAVTAAFRGVKETSAAKLRDVLAAEATQSVFEAKREAIDVAMRTLKELQKENVTLKEQFNAAARRAKDKEVPRAERKEIIVGSQKLKARLDDVKAQIAVTKANVQEFGAMQYVTTLDEFRDHVRRREFSADAWAIAVIERKLRMKTVVLQRNEDDVDGVLQCGGDAARGMEGGAGGEAPKHYVLLDRENDDHYQLVSADRRILFTFEQLPLKVKTLVVDKCMERVGGSFGSIPAFRDFQVQLRDVVPKTAQEIAEIEDEEVQRGREALLAATGVIDLTDDDDNNDNDDATLGRSSSTSSSSSSSVGVVKALERATTAVDSPGLFNPNILFRFHAGSSDSEPGKVTGERLPAAQRPKFALLQRQEHWRRKLDDAWTGAPFSVAGGEGGEGENGDGGLRWSSVVHYLTAAPLRETNPAAYRALSLDGEGLSPAQAVAAITEAPATTKRKAVRGIYMDDYLRGVARVDLEALRMRALTAKFSQNVDVRTALLLTLDAQLHATARGQEPVSDIPLMLVRAKLAAQQQQQQTQ